MYISFRFHFPYSQFLSQNIIKTASRERTTKKKDVAKALEHIQKTGVVVDWDIVPGVTAKENSVEALIKQLLDSKKLTLPVCFFYCKPDCLLMLLKDNIILADQTDNGERPKKSEFPTTLRFTPPLKHL
jgi:hypothetical protein